MGRCDDEIPGTATEWREVKSFMCGVAKAGGQAPSLLRRLSLPSKLRKSAASPRFRSFSPFRKLPELVRFRA